MIDTGVYGNHDEFKDSHGESRVAPGATFLTDESLPLPPADDKICQPHGTHCASLAAGNTFGPAKGAVIVPVRVLDCYGSGWTSDIISGISWAIDDAKEHAGLHGTRSVFSISLGGGKRAGS